MQVINAEELEAQLKRIYEFPVMKKKKKLEAVCQGYWGYWAY